MINLFAQLIDGSNLPHTTKDSVLNGFTIAYMIIGAVGFLFLVITGVRYVFARGDSNKISESKNAIQHIIIGIVIVGLATSIVQFVVGRF